MDPLRPFLSLVRSLWGSNTQSANRTQAGTPAHSTDVAGHIAASPPIERRLQSQLNALTSAGAWNPQRAREVFVRQVLLAELGEELAADPAFVELVSKVSAQLGGDPRISIRLDELLQALAASA
jgi:stage V sporulation protein SpoVS